MTDPIKTIKNSIGIVTPAIDTTTALEDELAGKELVARIEQAVNDREGLTDTE
jgi:hypothetical protein